MTPTEFVERLEGVKRNGQGWVARCPTHEDREQSLSVGQGDDGRVLLKCFAGCDAGAIAGAVGLKLKDLFPRKEGGRGLSRSMPRQKDCRSSSC
jgi:putative DNA primase/helicase